MLWEAMFGYEDGPLSCQKAQLMLPDIIDDIKAYSSWQFWTSLVAALNIAFIGDWYGFLFGLMDDYIVHRLILAEYALECGSWANAAVDSNKLIQDYDKL